MKKLKRKIALLLALCMVLTCITPAYADVETVLEATASDAVIREADEILEITEESSPAEAEYDPATPSDAEHIALEESEKDQKEIVPEKATPSNAKREEKDFVRETVVDGIKITLTADPGVFPDGAELFAEKVEDESEEEAIEEAVEKERGSSVNVAKSYKFDIKMLLDGEEIQPDTEKGNVKVSFALAETVSSNTDINVYHVTGEGEDLTAEPLDTEEEITKVTIDGDSTEGTVITSEIPGFSFYVIEITYDLLQYRLGAESVLLSRILSLLQIPGEVFEAESMDPDLFTVEPYAARKGEWVVTPVKSSESSGTLKVQAGKTIHEITILISNVKREDVRFRDEEGVMQAANCVILQSCTDYSFYANEWYAVTGDIEITNRIENKAPIGQPSHLILADGARISIKGGIHNGHESEIIFYGQNNDSGELFVHSVTGYASAIGGDADESNGVIRIHGGRFDVLSAIFAAGIGAGMNGGIGTIEITGGTIKAEGGGAGAGIGGGIQCSLGGSITIKGGNITAVGGGNVATGIGAGIGSETHGDLEIDDEGLYIEVGQPGGKVKTCEEYRRDRDHYVYIHPGPRYTVKHHYQALDGKTYEPAQLETRHGHEGALTRAVPYTPEGFSWLPFDQQPVKGDGSTVIEIYYNRNPYAIIFDANGHGVAPQRINALYGQAISEPEPPTAVGFNFCGWYEDMDCTVPFEFTTMPSGGKIVFAKWEKTTRKYEVTWMLNDITKIDVTEVLEGEMPVHENPTYQDRIFVGWQPELKKATGPAKYVAYFEARMGRQAVSFNTNGGTFVNTQLVDHNTRAERPADPTKDGYTFAGWYREDTFVTPFDFNDLVNTDLLLHAKWKPLGAGCTIIWKDWDGRSLAVSEIVEGEVPKYPGTSKPKRSGYIFTGWTPEIDKADVDRIYTATYVKQTIVSGGGGGTVSTTVKATPTFSSKWYSDELGVWRIRNSAGQTVVNAWLCDDVIKANGQNVWYLLREDGAMIANGLVQDKTGNFYSLETEHNGYFGMLRYQNGTYNCNGQQVYLTFNHEHNGSFGAITNAEGLEKLKTIYGVTQYGIGNENAVYTAAF